jgi:hypothetical protein
MDNLQSPGHAKLMQQCIKEAAELGLENVSADWAGDLINKKSMLHLKAGTTSETEVGFDPQEIEEYNRGIGVDVVNTRIREALLDST